MSGIVERLRAKHILGALEIDQQRQEAADRIEALEAALHKIDDTTIDTVAIGIARAALHGDRTTPTETNR